MPTPVFQQIAKTIELLGDGSEANSKINVRFTYTFSDGLNLRYVTTMVNDYQTGDLTEQDITDMDAAAQVEATAQ